MCRGQPGAGHGPPPVTSLSSLKIKIKSLRQCLCWKLSQVFVRFADLRNVLNCHSKNECQSSSFVWTVAASQRLPSKEKLCCLVFLPSTAFDYKKPPLNLNSRGSHDISHLHLHSTLWFLYRVYKSNEGWATLQCCNETAGFPWCALPSGAAWGAPLLRWSGRRARHASRVGGVKRMCFVNCNISNVIYTH